MSLLAFNHGAQGIFSWVWPTSDRLAAAHSQLARVVTGNRVATFLAGTKPGEVEVTVPGKHSGSLPGEQRGEGAVDAAFWLREGTDKVEILISVVNTSPDRLEGPVALKIPGPTWNGTHVRQVLWGGISLQDWGFHDERLHVPGLAGMSTNLALLVASKASA